MQRPQSCSGPRPAASAQSAGRQTHAGVQPASQHDHGKYRARAHSTTDPSCSTRHVALAVRYRPSGPLINGPAVLISVLQFVRDVRAWPCMHAATGSCSKRALRTWRRGPWNLYGAAKARRRCSACCTSRPRFSGETTKLRSRPAGASVSPSGLKARPATSPSCTLITFN